MWFIKKIQVNGSVFVAFMPSHYLCYMFSLSSVNFYVLGNRFNVSSKVFNQRKFLSFKKRASFYCVLYFKKKRIFFP
jgi:hypothetical protein